MPYDLFAPSLDSVKDWLKPIEHPHYVLYELHESGLCKRFPAEVLLLLNAVIANQPWGSEELSQCLGEIVQVDPRLLQDARYLRLEEYSRR